MHFSQLNRCLTQQKNTFKNYFNNSKYLGGNYCTTDDIFTETQSSGHLLNNLANDKMKKVFLFELKQANWNRLRKTDYLIRKKYYLEFYSKNLKKVVTDQTFS